jgi:hypothetical protein
MRLGLGRPKYRPLLGAILAVALGAGGTWTAPAVRADEHNEHGGHQHGWHEHEFHEHEFHDPRYLDHRYHHNHYYPPVGFVFGALPPGYFAIGYRGARFYFGGGVWYRAYAPGRYVVVAPPVGVVIPALPPFYTTVWVGGIPYYYADDVYYVQTPQGFMVAAPPPQDVVVEQPPAGATPPYVEQPTQAPPPPPSAGAQAPATPTQQVFAYPQHDQSVEQQAKDRYECHTWAVSQTGFDPSRPQPGGGTLTQTDDYRRAMGACLEARGYTVK